MEQHRAFPIAVGPIAVGPIAVGLIAVALAAAGCMGAPVDVGGLGAELELEAEVRLLDREVPASRWQSAPAGCEGMLSGAPLVAVVEGAPELLAVLNAAGELLCVDSWAAIDGELGSGGSQPFGEGPIEAQPEVGEPGTPGGDPSPQPSDPIPGTGTSSGDPSPQPSDPAPIGTVQGDPSPQPSQPVSHRDTLAKGDPSPQPSCPAVSGRHLL